MFQNQYARRVNRKTFWKVEVEEDAGLGEELVVHPARLEVGSWAVAPALDLVLVLLLNKQGRLPSQLAPGGVGGLLLLSGLAVLSSFTHYSCTGLIPCLGICCIVTCIPPFCPGMPSQI